MWMQVRLKAPRIGDVVIVKDCEMHFHLPAGLPDRTSAVLMGRDSGSYIVHAFGRNWNIPLQCVEHDEERCLNGVWLDRWDRRVRKVEARRAAAQLQAELREERKKFKSLRALP
jgi:hypothetical protein